MPAYGPAGGFPRYHPQGYNNGCIMQPHDFMMPIPQASQQHPDMVMQPSFPPAAQQQQFQQGYGRLVGHGMASMPARSLGRGQLQGGMNGGGYLGQPMLSQPYAQFHGPVYNSAAPLGQLGSQGYNGGSYGMPPPVNALRTISSQQYAYASTQAYGLPPVGRRDSLQGSYDGAVFAPVVDASTSMSIQQSSLPSGVLNPTDEAPASGADMGGLRVSQSASMVGTPAYYPVARVQQAQADGMRPTQAIIVSDDDEDADAECEVDDGYQARENEGTAWAVVSRTGAVVIPGDKPKEPKQLQSMFAYWMLNRRKPAPNRHKEEKPILLKEGEFTWAEIKETRARVIRERTPPPSITPPTPVGKGRPSKRKASEVDVDGVEQPSAKRAAAKRSRPAKPKPDASQLTAAQRSRAEKRDAARARKAAAKALAAGRAGKESADSSEEVAAAPSSLGAEETTLAEPALSVEEQATLQAQFRAEDARERALRAQEDEESLDEDEEAARSTRQGEADQTEERSLEAQMLAYFAEADTPTAVQQVAEDSEESEEE
ncbi:hypothetical protein LTR62_002376 [Meristemomyces frigidus]|uniref:Uncharacterized protein n=1 Tax=Meristemomyces frigidus TaxID=1508187 RepID=A0AAN7TRC1_9PEZI|nr:hypothetical protein LTR62_002376 [Meristemomyces frigidus]